MCYDIIFFWGEWVICMVRSAIKLTTAWTPFPAPLRVTRLKVRGEHVFWEGGSNMRMAKCGGGYGGVITTFYLPDQIPRSAPGMATLILFHGGKNAQPKSFLLFLEAFETCPSTFPQTHVDYVSTHTRVCVRAHTQAHTQSSARVLILKQNSMSERRPSSRSTLSINQCVG